MINKLVLLFALLALMVTIGIEARLLDLSSLEKLARVTRGILLYRMKINFLNFFLDPVDDDFKNHNPIDPTADLWLQSMF